MDYHELVKYFHSLDRSFFVEDDMKEYAGQDTPLPIGFGQTISQPSLVLEMTKFLSPNKDSKVLEIGTGSGFQTAILAKMSLEVYTIERIDILMEKAKKRLDTLKFSNIYYKTGDGSNGWQEYAPYDRIMVTAAASVLPDELINQLANGGRMIIPIGPRNVQKLQLITKMNNGKINIETMELVRFVEFKGKYGWDQ